MAPQPRKYPVSPSKPLGEYTKDEILWRLRTELEGDHRHDIHLYAVMLHYLPSVGDIDHLPEMETSDVFDACNKSVPVYILRDARWHFLSHVLHNYIYRRWFRPYRSEIECQRFICKFITPKDLPNETMPSQTTVDSLASLNSAICTQVTTRLHAYEEQLALGVDISSLTSPGDWFQAKDPRLHILQPLFQALMIVVCSENYRNEDSKTVGKLPVFLVRTGIEDGLSAPITFETIADKIDGHHTGEARNAIKTTLETAIDFVMSLEARETAAFGFRPDPIAAWESPSRNVPRVWKETLGNELIGPSSKYVDAEKYPEWAGDGEDYDSRLMVIHEERGFRMEAQRVAGMWS